jgi:hypothetical protein
MSRGDLHLVTPGQPADPPGGVPVTPGPRQGRRAREPGDGPQAGNGRATAPAGQPGHGRAASLRRQPPRLVEGRLEHRCTGAFEVICRDCGDHPYLDYSQVPPRLQRLRGPFTTIEAGLAAYEEHLGLST